VAGNELDPQRARAALEVVRQHPAMTLVAVSPVLIGAGLVWWFVNPALAILLLVVAGTVGAMRVLRK
jgi:hypothetical protein